MKERVRTVFDSVCVYIDGFVWLQMENEEGFGYRGE
jgi:hypothetical protein